MFFEKIILVFALLGSALYVFDKIQLLLTKKQDAPQPVPQPQEPTAERDAVITALRDSVAKLEQQIASMRDDRLAALAEARQKRQQEIDLQPVDPISRIMGDVEARARQCMLESKQFALKAVEASGRERTRLLEKARELANRADEYRAVANDTLIDSVAETEAVAVIRKAKSRRPATKSNAAAFEVID